MSSIVFKFGGTSLRDANRIIHVSQIIKNQLETEKNVLIVVVSAIGNITDQLSELSNLVLSKKDYSKKLSSIINFHLKLSKELVSKNNLLEGLQALIKTHQDEIKQILNTIRLSGFSNQSLQELIIGYGEIWSSLVISSYLESLNIQNEWLDARDIIVIEKQGSNPIIDWKESKSNYEKIISNFDLMIVPGFVARTKLGEITTLGRNGSDLSASILAVLARAEVLHIWTDVNGIYSADPKIVDDASVLSHMSYFEALEMAYFGANILHPASLVPAINNKIPIIVRNTFHPELPGTKVHYNPVQIDSSSFVKGFATLENISIVTIQGSGMIGVPGISEKLFASLHEEDISVIMISQASSEFSISIALLEKDGKRAKQAIERKFAFEIQNKLVHAVLLETNCAILAVVGDNMINQPGIASILFNSLSRSRINVRMISQGSSERNISVILDQKDLKRGLKTAHAAFYLSYLTISVGIIGIGRIGSVLLNQLKNESSKLKKGLNIDLRLRGIANSKSMIIDKEININNWQETFEQNKEPINLDKFEKHINSDNIPHSVIIDCTSSDIIPNKYEKWLNEGIHVITPNKKANSGNYSTYETLLKFIRKGPSTNPLDKTTHYFYETTVGAGLPIITTMKDLLKTGDKIKKIEGVFSGTLSYIFNSLSPEGSFSKIVKEAHQKGYTEPDPRDDLSGSDVARKLIILARENGMNIELDDVEVESLIPQELLQIVSVDEFLSRLEDYDETIQSQLQIGYENSQVPRYVGQINEKGKCKVGLEFYDNDHPFSNLKGAENIISFTTNRYNTYPLIVQGPGAGAEVTSAGVFAELLRLADLLGST